MPKNKKETRTEIIVNQYFSPNVFALKDKCILFSIDSSTRNTGVSVYASGILYQSYIIDANIPATLAEDRIPLILKEFYNLAEFYKPDIIFIEDTWGGNNFATQKQLTRLQGAIIGWSIFNQKDFHFVSPSLWREVLYPYIDEKGLSRKNKRNEWKAIAIDYIKEKYNIDVNDDVAESICIGEYASTIYADNLIEKK